MNTLPSAKKSSAPTVLYVVFLIGVDDMASPDPSSVIVCDADLHCFSILVNMRKTTTPTSDTIREVGG